MEKLLELLKDGHARTTVMLASELNTTSDDIRRKLEYMENMGIIRRVTMYANSCGGGCGGCSSCGGGDEKCDSGCSSCMPSGDLMNMGEMWEVVKK